jgi:hypothetical protein
MAHIACDFVDVLLPMAVIIDETGIVFFAYKVLDISHALEDGPIDGVKDKNGLAEYFLLIYDVLVSKCIGFYVNYIILYRRIR